MTRTISMLHPSELHESPDNPREIGEAALDALIHSLRQDPGMMEARPIIATPEGEVVCGNMRLRAARRLDWTEVPVYIKSFDSEAQKREWMLRDNNSFGEWVPDELSALVAQHAAEGADLHLLGFSDQELRDIQGLADDPDLPVAGDAGDNPIPGLLGVVIDCRSEDEQATLLEEFNERGLTCRALMA